MTGRCLGETVLVDGVAYWRCVWDGSHSRDPPSGACPCCGRAAEAGAAATDCGHTWSVRFYEHPRYGRLQFREAGGGR